MDPLVAAIVVALVLLLFFGWRFYFASGATCTSQERMDGKTVIITGGNTGIGKETALDLARRGAKIILACRDEKRASEAVSDIKRSTGNENISFKKLDLASLASVRTFCEQVLEEEERIDVLIANAGVMFPPYQITEDGFELSFAVNHLGHFLLTMLLLDKIKATCPSRIIILSSLAHFAGYLDFEDMMWKKRYNAHLAYCRSKLANVMFARELAKRLSRSGVTVYAIHPGSVNTELTRHMLSGWLSIFKPLFLATLPLLIKSPKEGAQTPIYCAVSKQAEGITGKYWAECAVARPSSTAQNEEACRKLWKFSEKLVGL